MKTFKTILIILIAIFGTGFLAIPSANATQVDELVVEYWSEAEGKWIEWLPGPASFPVFSETNFLPGEDVARLIRVTNYSESIQRIAVEAINEKNIDDLASQLDIIIKEGSNTIYSKTLKQFFDDGEIYLSSLAGLGGQTQYDFTVSFKSGADNDYQGKSVGFDLLVGFEGTEGVLPLPLPGGSAGGGGGGIPGMLPPGLTIKNETNTTATENSVTIAWNTSYPATSQVIYAKDGESHTLCLTQTEGCALGTPPPPKYGYERTTLEYDSFLKVLIHSVVIDGLTSGTKYYYRAVSHASLAISTEHSFTTLTLEEAMAQATAMAAAARPAGIGETGGAQSSQAGQPAAAGEEQPVSGTGAPSQTAAIGENIPEQNPAVSNQSLLAAIVTFGTGSVWVGILTGLIILAIVVYVIYSFFQRKRKNLG